MRSPVEASGRRRATAGGFDAEIPALTGLRFFAAFSVAVAHGSGQLLKFEGPPTHLIYWLPQIAGFGMTLFFVLSGFVIHYNYRKRVTEQGLGGLGAFMWARFARLYPLYLFMLVLDVLLGRKLMVFMSENADGFQDVLRSLPYYLLLVQSWFYIPFGDSSLIYVTGTNIALTWSISTEWFFYIAYPLVALLVLRVRRPAVILGGILVWSTFWSTSASILAGHAPEIDGWAVNHFGSVAGLANGSQVSFVRWLLYFSPYLRIGEFILGCLVAQLYLQLREWPVSEREQAIGKILLITGVLSVPSALYLTYSPTGGWVFLHSLSYNFALAPSSALIIFCAARYENFLSRFLRARRVVALGEASYSIYLIHFLILMLISGYLGQTLPATIPNIIFLGARFVFTLCVIILVSIGLHAFLEVPARSWLRGLWSDKPGAERRAVALSVLASPAAAAIVVVAIAYALFPVMIPAGAGIRLVTASYGLNCGAKAGNATKVLGRACDGKETCDYRLDVVTLGGDPAGGCAKDFTAAYVCAPDNAPFTKNVPPEAGLGSWLLLSCSAQPAQEAAASKLDGDDPVAASASNAAVAKSPTNGIQITSATYGLNCGAKAGNATRVLGRACDGMDTCDYRLDLVNLGGDPAGGCAKDFSAAYVCVPGNAPFTKNVPPEAGLGSRLLLRCPAQPARDPATAESGPADPDATPTPHAILPAAPANP
jgi:peptidoglycan/LPS O-acetylase OafA/YrhL